MGSEWQTLSLRDAGIQLIDCDHRTPSSIESGYPYIAIPQLKGGRIELGDVRRISKADFEDWTKKLKPKEHDVIVVRRCSSGDSAVVPRGLECAIGQNLVVLRSDGKRVLPEFLRWIVRSAEWWEQVRKFMNVGAVFNSLKCKDIPDFEVVVPPLEAQREIAGLLGGLDNRIVLLRESNATLEAIAKAFFKSWFVDFDPVHAKAEGRDPEGMPPEVADRFPDVFDGSKLGQIPSTWSVEQLGIHLIVLETGRRPKGGVGDISEGVPSIGAESIIRIGQFDYGKTKYVTHDFFDGMRSGKLMSRDVLLYKDGGKPGTFLPRVSMFGDGFPFETCGINEHVFRIRTGPCLSQAYLYFWLWSDIAMHELKHRGGKAAIPGINQADVREIPVLIPSAEVLAAFNEVADPAIARILSNSKEIRVLEELRDTLLPRLMSGNLRIPEVVV